jgi:dipeptidyl aminopeptidase/acylaminoacyl peptidase
VPAFALVIAAFLCPAAGAQAVAPLPSVEAFYRDPAHDHAELSPSGRLLAVTVGIKGKRVGLAVIDLANRSQSKVVAHFANTDVSWFTWVGEEHLILTTLDSSRTAGEQPWGSWISVRADGKDAQTLSGGRLYQKVVGNKPHVMMGAGRYGSYGQLIEVLPRRVDVSDGRYWSLAEGTPDHVTGWLFDPKGEPRLATSLESGTVTVYWRAPGSKQWTPISRHGQFEGPFEPEFVDGNGALYVTTAEGPERIRVLRRFDFSTGRPAPEALVRAAGFDFAGDPIFDDEGRLLGIRVETDAEATYWFDATLSALQKTIDALLPGQVNRISCRRCHSADGVVLVHSWSDRDPGRYALYDVSRKVLEPLVTVRPDIDPRQMATLDLHRVRVRDGLEIPVWVTMPPGRAAPRPAVVLVHGGPWVKGGSWRWHDDAQFLASRGYVVIEPEFRGSTGYGDTLFRAGWKQWGKAMQDDVTDATLWAVREAGVDPKRICIAGASYGGYATLMGLVREPDLYRCGIAWVAVTDPRMLFDPAWTRFISEEARAHSIPTLLGDPELDAAALAATAPVELAARIRTPVMLAFGGSDGRVAAIQGLRMRNALRDAGQQPEWIYYEWEGHGWVKEENRFDFARRMETFLAKHLK